MLHPTVILNVNDKRAIVPNVTITLLLFSTMFCSFRIFVEAEIISKWYAFIVGNILCCLGSLFAIKKLKIGFDRTAILMIIFICYLFIRTLCSNLETNNVFYLSIITFILFYFYCRIFTVDYLRFINFIILFSCLVQAGFGLMQYFGIFHTYKVFKIIGTFDNPAGFASCLAIGFPFCFSVITKGGWKRCVGIVSLIIIAASIILSGSRAGIIAIVIVAAVYWGNKYRYLLKRYRKHVFLLFALLLLAGVGLFFLKKDSAIGRLLIWKNSCDMVK